MAQATSIHTAYRPFTGGVAPVAVTPIAYPTTVLPQAAPVAGDSTSFSGLAKYAGAGVAGLKAGDSLGRAAMSVRRSQAARRSGYYTSRGYRASGYRSSSAGVGTKVGGHFMGAVKSSIVWGSILSVGMNAYDLMKNRITFAQAAGNVTGDVMSSAVGGVGAAALSTAGTALLGGMLGTGLLMGAASIGLGIVGFMVADGIFRKTSLFQKTTSGVSNLFA